MTIIQQGEMEPDKMELEGTRRTPTFSWWPLGPALGCFGLVDFTISNMGWHHNTGSFGDRRTDTRTDNLILGFGLMRWEWSPKRRWRAYSRAHRWWEGNMRTLSWRSDPQSNNCTPLHQEDNKIEDKLWKKRAELGQIKFEIVTVKRLYWVMYPHICKKFQSNKFNMKSFQLTVSCPTIKDCKFMNNSMISISNWLHRVKSFKCLLWNWTVWKI